jgi:hypothetical protein
VKCRPKGDGSPGLTAGRSEWNGVFCDIAVQRAIRANVVKLFCVFQTVLCSDGMIPALKCYFRELFHGSILITSERGYSKFSLGQQIIEVLDRL